PPAARRHSGWRSTRPGGWRSSAPLRATTQSSSSLRASALDAPCRRVSRSWLEFPTKRGGDVNSVTRVTRIRLLAACAAAALMAAPRPSLAQQAGMAGGSAALNTLTAAERSAGWRLLFDGKTTAGWRGYKQDSVPPGWQVVDGALTRVNTASDIITRDKFRNFELTLEWNIAPAGNSGIFYRGSEDDDAIYWNAPEMQVLDDAGHVDGKSRLTAAGAAYDVYPSPAGVVKPAGTWNHGMEKLTHWPYTVNPIAAIVAPFFLGLVADRYFATEKVLGVLHLLGGVVMFAVPQATGAPAAFILLLLVYNLCYMPTLGLAN